MTHAEQYSTSEPGAPPVAPKKHSRRVLVVLALASSLGIASTVISSTRPASADQISDAKAQASAIASKIHATELQIQTLTGEYTAADYQLTKLDDQIAVSRSQIAKDQAEVDKDQSQLRVQAISDYTSSGTSTQLTQMFSSNVNVNGIRSEYSSIATGNVTTTIDKLHTAQTKLQATQDALQQQQTQATAAKNSLATERNRASNLAAQDQSALNGVNAHIQTLVEQQQAAQAAAAKAAAARAFSAKVAAAQAAQSEARTVSRSASSSTGGSSGSSGSPSAASGPAPPLSGGAAGAVQAAEREIGVPYVWGGSSPAGFDCSGLVEWAYAQVGIGLPRTSGAQFGATIHIPLADIAPGDLLFYGPGGSEHVAMYVGGGSMIEAPFTGSSVHITGVRTSGGFVGVGRVG